MKPQPGVKDEHHAKLILAFNLRTVLIYFTDHYLPVQVLIKTGLHAAIRQVI